MPALSTGDLGKRLSVALGIGPDMPMSRRGSTMNTLTRSDSNLHLNRGTGYEDAGANGKNMVRREAGVGVKLASSREEEVMVPFVHNPLMTHQVHVINTKVKLIRPDFTNTSAGDGSSGYKPIQPEMRQHIQPSSYPIGGVNTPNADPIADLLHRMPPGHVYHAARGPLLNPDQVLDLVVQHVPQHAPGVGYVLAPPYPMSALPPMRMPMGGPMGMQPPMGYTVIDICVRH